MSEARGILALNCGSSSLKFGLYEADRGGALRLVCQGEAEEIGRPEAAFWIQKSGEERQQRETAIANQEAALELAWTGIADGGTSLSAIGHRLVHGGPKVREHCVLTEETLRDLEKAADFAPLHVPPALAVVRACQKRNPGTAQAICLDTAFHRTLPDVSRTLPLPADLRDEGVERYGFHGLSIESVLAQMEKIPVRLVIAHLGNGCSVTAVRDGKSVDTSMAMTPNAGLMMGTRCGDLDPGVATYLAHHHGASADEIDDLLNRKSGLLGVSETSSDVRELLGVRAQDSRADLALRMFGYQVKKQIGAMATALGGMDGLVFTGGIGEHAAAVRDEIAGGLGLLGQFELMVLPAKEELQIAAITLRLTG